MSDFFSVSIDKTQDLPIILGGTSSFTINVKNLSTDIRFYNLNINIDIPDGLTIVSSSESITSSVLNPNGSKKYSWVNLKDLAPLEIDYTFTVTLKASSTFKDNSTIPFGYIFSNFVVSCQVDTMPRGSYDIGNQIILKDIYMTFLATRYSCYIKSPGKVLKGAGSTISLNDYTQIAQGTCTFTNNELVETLINIELLLPDGIRYIGNIISSGTDASQFINPIISTVSIEGLIYTKVYFSSITLSLNSNTSFTFEYAIWNRYENNLGNLIYHKTPFSFSLRASTENNFNSKNTVTASAAFVAMDLIIISAISKAYTDVFETLFFSFSFFVGGYYDIKDIVVNYLLPDGINYISSSVTPSSEGEREDLEGYYLTYDFPLGIKNSSSSVTISTTVNDYYRYKKDGGGLPLPVVAFDLIKANCDISGILLTLLSTVTDSSNSLSRISIPIISKKFLNGYYEDGSEKSIEPLAPQDFGEFELTYDASSLKAIQKAIFIDDFFPLSSGPIDNLEYFYTGYKPNNLTPKLISPHGVDFDYGDIPSESLITIRYKLQIKDLGSSSANNNLLKVKGVNTSGYAYSLRDQIPINIGSPNISLNKSVSGPAVKAIKGSEVYRYTLIISNSSNLGSETDAFNFVLTDELSSWFTINPSSINVTGDGLFEEPTIFDERIEMNIIALVPGESLTLTYDVEIKDILAPAVKIKTTATNSAPYSQLNSPSSYSYTNQVKSDSTTIRSKSITLTKSSNIDTFKIGSNIIYNLSVKIPQGTIAHNLRVIDQLPQGLQEYLGGATKDGIPVNPSISNNTISFQEEEYINALSDEVIINYRFSCKIIEGTKPLNAVSIIQNNIGKCIYKKLEGDSDKTITKSLPVTINVPNMVLAIQATDNNTNATFTGEGRITSNSVLNYKLTFTNNSAIRLVNGLVEIPIDDNLSFHSITNSIFCTASFSLSEKKIIINIPYLDSKAQGFLTFTLLPLSTLRAGESGKTEATAVSYFNDIHNKAYGGEKSNLINLSLYPGLTLLPSLNDRIDDSTSFRVSPPGATVTILNHFQNTGGGLDDFNLRINTVALEYELYIDDIYIGTVPANTPYNEDLPQMQNLPSGTRKDIKIVATLPDDIPIGTGYDFIVTTTSKTSPNPTKTVINIDPNV